MHTAVIAAINILVIRNSRLGRPRIVIRCETPSRLCVRDGSRQESNNGRVPQEDDRGLGRLAPAAISSLRSPLPMLLLPSKPASCLRYVATAAYTRIQAHACRIAAFTAAGSSFRRSVGLPGRDARAPRRQADSAD